MSQCDREALRLLDEALDRLMLVKRLSSLSWEEFISDFRNVYALRMLIVELVEALAAACVRLLRCRGVDPGEGYVQVFRRMGEHIISPSDAEVLVRLARLRNLIVHRYWEVNDRLVWRAARESGVEKLREIIDKLRAVALGGEEKIR